MSRESVIAILSKERSAVAFAMSWVPPEALRVLTWQETGADPAETLAAVAAALQLDLVFVPASEPWAVEAVRLLDRANVASAWAVSGVLGRLAERFGWPDVLRLSATEPGSLAFALSEGLHDALVEIRAGSGATADVVVVADDLAGPSGWLVAPDFALEALVPCYRQMAAGAALPVAFHSDGDVRAIYPALAAAGYSAVHVAVHGELAVQSATRAARDEGLVPMGGIEAAQLLRSGAARAGVHVAALAAGGPFVVCDDGGMTSAEDVAAFSTALDAARKAIEGGQQLDLGNVP